MSPLAAHRGGKKVLIGVLGAVAMIGAQPFIAPHPSLVWNATASAPIGLYLLLHRDVRRGDLVFAQTPRAVRKLAAARGYIPANVPLVKRIAAVQGDVVCADADWITIDGRFAAMRHRQDSHHRFLPRWNGCHTLGPSEVFLLMACTSASFDGRYFGITPRSEILGRLSPLWTD